MVVSSRILTVLPCAAAPTHCTSHKIGRNELQHPLHQTQKNPLSLLTKLFKRHIQTPPQQCHLLALPVDLLFELTTHLTPSQRIALTLTCKALYTTLGTHSFSLQKTHPADHLTLLELLHRDQPTHRLCLPCKTLHSPASSTLKLPRNRLRRQEFHPLLQAYLLAPSDKGEKEILYWLSAEHVRRVLAGHICPSTLRCAGSISLGTSMRSTPALHSAVFAFHVAPVATRRNTIFHARLQIQFGCVPARWWSEAHVRELLRNFDVRCCLHCRTECMVDEIVCFLFHGPTPENGRVGGCVRAGETDVEDGCGHHDHEGVCTCVSQYRIEQITHASVNGVLGVRILIWQWLGHRKDDLVLKQKGVLQNIYEDALWDEGGT